MADISKSIAVSVDVQNNASSALASISASAEKTGADFDSLSASLNRFIATEGGVKTANDDIKDGLEKTGGGANVASTSFMTLVGSMFTAQAAFSAFQSVLSSVKGFLTDSVEQALDYSGTVAILTQNIKNAGLSYQQLLPQIQAYATAQIKLGFNDDDTTKSMGKLLLITGNYNQALKLNQLAMDLSANKGVSLEQATTSLAQVMQGAGGRALMQYGLSFKDGASAAEILDELQQKVAGSAEALAGSPEGAVRTMTAQWNDMKQNLGTQLLPTVQILFKTFEDNLPGIIDLINATVGPLNLLIKGLANAGTLYAEMKNMYDTRSDSNPNGDTLEQTQANAIQKQGTDQLQSFVDAYNKVHKAKQINISDLQGEQVNMKLLREASADYKSEQDKITGNKPPTPGSGGGNPFAGMGVVGTDATTALKDMQKQVEDLGNSISSVNQKSVKFAFDSTASFQDFISTISDTKSSNDDYIKEAEAGFSALSTKIQATQTDITTLTGKIVDAQTTFAAFVTSTNSSAGDSMAQIVIDAQNAIPTLQKQISTASPGSDTSDLQKQLADKQKIVQQSKTTEFTSNQEFVKQLAFLQGEQGKTELEQALDVSKQKILAKLDETEQIIAQYSVQIQADQKAHDTYVQFQKDATKVLEDNVKIRQNSLTKEGSNLDVLKGHVDDLTTSYNNLAKAMQKAYPTQSTLFPSIATGSPHATGGAVSPNTAYLVGEHGPEMFVPNGGGTVVPNGGSSGSGGAISIVINNPTVRNDQDIQTLTDAMIKKLARQQELAKYRAYK